MDYHSTNGWADADRSRRGMAWRRLRSPARSVALQPYFCGGVFPSALFREPLYFSRLQFIAGLASGTFIPLTIGFVVQNLPPRLWAYGIAAYALNLEFSLHISASLEGCMPITPPGIGYSGRAFPLPSQWQSASGSAFQDSRCPAIASGTQTGLGWPQ